MREVEINQGGDLLRAQLAPGDRAVVQMHRRGHHVQKAHGRRVSLATDNDHTSGGMIALMPTAADAKRLALPGGEPAAELHCTLFFLGDDGAAWTEEQRDRLEGAVRQHTAGLAPVQARVFGVAHWNGTSEKPAWVWNVGDDPEHTENAAHLGELRALAATGLSMTPDLPEVPEQHSPWSAHICAAYDKDLTLLRALEKRLGPVTFDRIRLSFGDDDRDILLGPEAVTASGFRREPLPHEDSTDFAEHNRQWEGAVSTATSRMISVYAGWRTWIGEQIKAGADTPEEWASISLGPEQGVDQAADILHEAMTGLALRAGQSLARQAEQQGVEIPEWSLPDDTLTAAVGGRRLLRSVAQMSADLLSTSVVQAAKRAVTGLFTQQAPAEQIAAEVDRTLAEAQDSLLRGPVSSAMSTAQTAGRQAVLEAAPPGEYYASEMLDRNTCGPCRAVDGEQFSDLEIAIKAYPVMGYKDCVGPRYGNSCRGMIVARWTPEADESGEAQTASAATMRPSDDQPGEGDHAMTTEALRKGDPSEGTPKDKRLKENQKYESDDCPPGMEPDQQTGKCVKMAGATQALEVTGPAPEDIGGENTAPWRGPLTVEGIETGDGREFDTGALTWADLPLPLRWNKEDSHGGEPRTLAVNIGRIDKIWREDSGLIMGEGLLDLGNDDGREVHRKIEGKFLRGVSVDVDSVKDADMELVWPDPDPDASDDPDPFAQLFASPEKVVFHRGRIRAATLVDIPAFAEAYVALLDEAGAVVAGGERIGALRATHLVRSHTTGVEPPRTPPGDWFDNPDLSVPTGITVSPEGRVYGHAALWGTCHIGQAGMCVTPPREDVHPYFMTGSVLTADGDLTSVGQITVGTGHADLGLGYRAASDHYDNTGWAVADVKVGNDSHGIWVAGAIRAGADPDRVHELRAAGQVSGDWRRIGSALRLVGLLAVNVPGFPVPKLSTKYTSGNQLALVAAGMPNLRVQMTEDELDQLAYRRIMEKLSRQVHGKE